MKKIMCLLLVLMLSLVVLTACGTNTATNETQQEQEISWEDMERIDVYLPDLEEELKKDWKDGDWRVFYEKYRDKVLVFANGVIQDNQLNSNQEYLRVSQGGDGRHASARFLFDEEDKTDEVINLPDNENVVLEGILQQPKENGAKPLYIFIEHTKLIEHSAWENPFLLPIDMEPVFEETKAELLSKYSFVKKIDFVIRKSQSGKHEDIEFITDIEPGTNAQEVLAYADYAARLLNENARKVDDTIAPSTGDSYGGLYKYNYLSILARPEGVVEAQNKYYIHDTISARVGDTINLQKAYR